MNEGSTESVYGINPHGLLPCNTLSVVTSFLSLRTPILRMESVTVDLWDAYGEMAEEGSLDSVSSGLLKILKKEHKLVFIPSRGAKVKY